MSHPLDAQTVEAIRLYRETPLELRQCPARDQVVGYLRDAVLNVDRQSALEQASRRVWWFEQKIPLHVIAAWWEWEEARRSSG